MPRLTKTFVLFYIGSLFSLLVAKQLAAQQAVSLPSDPVLVADLSLEDQVPSAIDLLGPGDGPAGRNRAALVHQLQCWIDGTECCVDADLNDPRVRELRRFLAFGPSDQHGVVVVGFPDQSRIKVRLGRVPDLDSVEWQQSVYSLEVLPATAHAPGLPAVPFREVDLASFVYDGPPSIEAALNRLKQRIEDSAEPSSGAPSARVTID